MYRNISLNFWILFFFVGCFSSNEKGSEKFQRTRANNVEVRNALTDIKTDIPLGNSMLYILDDYLIAMEIKPSSHKGIHLFNKNTFEYITSTGILGHGPGEIIRYGRLGIDTKNKVFWVPDHGKQMMMKFYLDSVLVNKMYKPVEGIKLNTDIFIERFEFLNDSIALGKAVEVLGSSSYQMQMVRLNINNNVTERYGYQHPEVSGKMANSHFKLSVANGFYVNCHVYCDLVTISDIDGKLRYNIYGPDKLENKEFVNTYYTGVDVFGGTILASYIGDVGTVINDYGRAEGNLPSKILAFDMEGNYKNTLVTGHQFSFFCVDQENGRLIAYYTDRENPLAYFNLTIDN